MYVKSESGRGPVWLRELRILCKLCKLWTERRSSRSSRVDLNALITRSCKNREGCSIRKRGGKPATHKHAIFVFFLAQKCVLYRVSHFSLLSLYLSVVYFIFRVSLIYVSALVLSLFSVVVAIVVLRSYRCTFTNFYIGYC